MEKHNSLHRQEPEQTEETAFRQEARTVSLLLVGAAAVLFVMPPYPKGWFSILLIGLGLAGGTGLAVRYQLWRSH